MQHQFANQELARLSYAEAIRSSRHHDRHVVDEVQQRLSRSRSLLDRLRAAVGDAFAVSLQTRPTA